LGEREAVRMTKIQRQMERDRDGKRDRDFEVEAK
jgi:hypothetical protein